MKPELLGPLPEPFELLVSVLGAAFLSVLGVYIEYLAVVTVQGSGEATFGYWAVVPGLVRLGFAYLLTVDRVLPTLAGSRKQVAGRDRRHYGFGMLPRLSRLPFSAVSNHGGRSTDPTPPTVV